MSSTSAPSDPLPVLTEISSILNTGLPPSSLSALLSLVEAGVSPEAIVAVVEELRKESASNANAGAEKTETQT